MATNLPTILNRVTQEGILEFSRQCYTMQGQQWNLRNQMRRIDLAYARETDQTAEQAKAKLSNRLGDSTRYQNMTMPVVMPAVEAAVVYQASVFLSGNPIFGVVANPKSQDAAMQMESLMEDHSTRGGWARHLQMFLRDGFKYNFSAIEVAWKDETSFSVETSPVTQAGKPKEIIWSGNTIRRLDPYNTIFDTRVAPTDVSKKGEFAGWTEIMSRVALKQFMTTLPEKMVENVKAAFESGMGGSSGGFTSAQGSYYLPPINYEALINTNFQAGTNWLAWAGVTGISPDIAYKNAYEVTTLYARIIPSDFKLRVPSPNTPQVWKFIFVNHQVLIYAERQTNAHSDLPILFGQPLEDGLSYQTKSLADNVTGIQEITSALMNSNIAARRRAISDRGLYDPSRISAQVINSDNPSAKMPVRPAAYGKPLSEAYYPIPFRDDQSGTIMQEIGSMIKLADVITGQNPARGGQFVKGNKTQSEYSDVMAHSNGRDQAISILLEAQVFTPMKNMLKLNILQYQGPKSLYYREKDTSVDIDPVALRNAVVEFKVTDGLTPASKLINSDSFQVALQVIGSSPQIGAGYNLAPMFSYMMKTQGAAIADFEKSNEQVAYEQAMQQWTQMAQLSLSKGMEWKQPQPTPEQFGYLQEGKLQQQNKKPDALASFQATLMSQAAANPAQQEQTTQPSQGV